MKYFFLLLVCLLTSPQLRLDAAGLADKAIRKSIDGIDVIAYPTEITEVVTFRGSLPAGDSFAPPGNLAIPTLVGEMLDKGTRKNDKFAIAAKLESVGALISFSVDGVVLSFNGKCLRKDLPLVISLLAEQLREPAFAEEELEKVKKQLAGDLRRALESTNYRAQMAFAASLYPAGHPNYQPPTPEFLAAMEAVKVEDLQAFHAAFYGPKKATLVFVGDLDVPELQATVGKAFAGWQGGKDIPTFPKATASTEAREIPVFMPGKTSVSVLLGQATGLQHSDADTLPLRAATAIFGSGFTGRLMANVRDLEGLTYGIGAGVSKDTFNDGEWRITASFAPALLEKGLASTKVQFDKWFTDGVTPAELDRTKSNLIGTFKVGLATTDGLAGALINTVHRGYALNWLDEYPQKVDALSLEQVNGAIKKYLTPDRMTLIEAGTLPKKPSGQE